MYQCINVGTDNKLRGGFPNTDHWGNTDPTIIYHAPGDWSAVLCFWASIAANWTCNY